MAVQIQLRRGTASQWTSANPILAEGEMGVELDTGKWKFGNGTGTWSVLAYGSGAALLDADKGDITVSGTGTVWTIDTGAVTYAKMQAASTTSRVLGASSTSTTIQELTLGTGLSLSGTTLSATGATVADADYGNITVSGTGTVWTIDNGVVTYAKMQAASTNSKVIGSSSTSTTLTELTLGTGLSLSGTTLTATGGVTDGDKGDITVSGTGSTWTIDTGVVTYAKMQAASTNSKILGSSSTSTTIAELTIGTGLSLSGTTLTATGTSVTDGDKGDITVSNTGTTWTIDANAVTYAKLQAASTNSKLLGTSSTSTTFAELTIGTGLSLSGTTLTATAVGLTDGDKGDITVSATGTSWAIDSGAVSYAKIQNVSATDKVLGRSTAGAGSIEEITCTAAGRALLDDADASAQRTTLGLGTLATQSGTFSGTSSGTNTGDQTISLTGDVTGSGTGSFAATIANGAVSTAKLGGDITTAGKALLDDADASAQRTTLGLGTLATQSGTFSGTSSGTNTGDQTITLTGDVTGSGTGSFAATIANQAVTNAKLANVATATIKGRVSASTGDPEDLTGTQATTLLDVFTSSLKGLAPSSGGGTTNFLRADGSWAAPAGGGTSAQVDTYTTTGTVHTWSKPSGAKAVEIIAVGAGGGGGGGVGSSNAVNRIGGSGGGGAACAKILYQADAIPASLYVVIGAGGASGAGGSSATGTSGGAGGNSTVATNNTNPPTSGILALGGGGGGGKGGADATEGVGGGGGGTAGAGTTGTGTSTVAGGLPASSALSSAIGGQGGQGGTGQSGAGSQPGRAEWGGGGGGGCRSDAANRSGGGSSMYGSGGGGTGGPIASNGTAIAGGVGGGTGRYLQWDTGSDGWGGGTVGTAGGATGGAGGAGANSGTTHACAGGGGGGGGGTTTGGAGGAGGFPGGGAGGGGAGGTTGGAGGTGGAGRVIIITYF